MKIKPKKSSIKRKMYKMQNGELNQHAQKKIIKGMKSMQIADHVRQKRGRGSQK